MRLIFLSAVLAVAAQAQLVVVDGNKITVDGVGTNNPAAYGFYTNWLAQNAAIESNEAEAAALQTGLASEHGLTATASAYHFLNAIRTWASNWTEGVRSQAITALGNKADQGAFTNAINAVQNALAARPTTAQVQAALPVATNISVRTGVNGSFTNYLWINPKAVTITTTNMLPWIIRPGPIVSNRIVGVMFTNGAGVVANIKTQNCQWIVFP